MRVEVLIPHWNRAPLLRRALSALALQTMPVAVCVADNGSTDDTAEVLATEFPDVRHLRLERNFGFGTAVNRAAASSDAELLVLLNNDAVAEPTFVERIIAAQRRSSAEMIAACLLRSDGCVDSLGVQIDTSLNAYDLGHGHPVDLLPTERPLAPTGGAAAFLKVAFDAVGGFDEAIFAYLEDVDLGLRMRLAGMRCEMATDARVTHMHAGTLGRGSARKNYLLGWSRGYIVWKYGANLSPRQRWRGLVTDGMVYAGQAIIDRNLGSIRGRIDSRRERSQRTRAVKSDSWSELDLMDLPVRAGLARRLARRR